MFLDRIRYTLDINPNENSWVKIGETLNKLEMWNSIDRNFTQKSHELDETYVLSNKMKRSNTFVSNYSSPIS